MSSSFEVFHSNSFGLPLPIIYVLYFLIIIHCYTFIICSCLKFILQCAVQSNACCYQTRYHLSRTLWLMF